jgi:hypothetical protein
MQLIGALLAICGFVAMNFILIVYISVKKMGGNLERRQVYVLSSVVLGFFVCAVVLTVLAESV